MSADMSGEQMQAKITAARREAEGLKDRIKRKKDDLADTTRELSPLLATSQMASIPLNCRDPDS
jgi:guanine nucleotide-binding protein G(I)/G(S)/G(T) subunit beta-1